MIHVKRVWINKHTGQKAVTIPKDSEIKKGDYVKIIPIKDETDEN